MPKGPVVKVEGLAELRRELRRLGDSDTYVREFREAGKRSAEVIVPVATSIAPRRSGALASTIRPLASGSSFAVAAGKASVPYAGPIHFGHPARGIKAQPFIIKAAERREPDIAETFLQAIDRLVRRAFPNR